jgi:dolichol-phosphate mannosyltransferase
VIGAPSRIPIAAPRVVAMPVAFNEELWVGRLLDRFQTLEEVDVAVVDDGSRDRTAVVVRDRGVRVIHRRERGGVGAAIRTAYDWARSNGYDICVIMSAHDKDRPADLPALIRPIVAGDADLVQGSRYLRGGRHMNMPVSRVVATRFLHPFLFSLAAQRWLTDTTNGYRALRLAVLDDPRLALDRPDLDGYALEPYLLLQLIKLGYAVCEVPVSKIYPEASDDYTKMRVGTDWWHIVRPVVTGWRRPR